MSDTLLLDRTVWDLVLTTEGDIAMASDPYSISQDIGAAVRLFLGEVWYDTSRGVPYFSEILGQAPPLEFLKAKISAAALTVPQVQTAETFITRQEGRALTGQVQFTYTAATGSTASTNPINSGILTFIGDNDGIVTFTGTNTLPLTYIGG